MDTNFLMPTVAHGNIAYGFASIAAALDLDVTQCVFVNGLVVNSHHPLDKRIAATDDLDIRAQQYVLSLVGAGSTVAILNINPAQLAYVQHYLADGAIASFPPAAPGRLYPGGSVIAAMQAVPAQSHPLLAGKVLSNSYCLHDVQQLARAAGAMMLNPPEQYLPFVCKSYVHQHAAAAGVKLASGVLITDAAQIDSAVQNFVGQLQQHGLDPAAVKCWVKAGALSGGQGIVPLAHFTPELLADGLTKIAQAYHDCGFFHAGTAKPVSADFTGIDYFMPLVIELDVGAMPGVRGIVANAGVQAVVGHKGITITGTSFQHTVNGEYQGAAMPEAHEQPYVVAAEAEAIKVLQKMWRDGYRGYAGVDVLVADTEAGWQGYVLEINPRLTGSTPMLGLVQRAARLAGAQRTANTASYLWPESFGFSDVQQALDGLLYQGDASQHQGFVPVVIDQHPGRPTLVKGVIIAASKHEAGAIRQKVINSIPSPL